MIKPLESQLTDALSDLERFGTVDSTPRSIAEYDEGTETADAIAQQALAVLSAARQLSAERKRLRNDFLQDQAERAMKDCDLYMVCPHHVSGTR